VGRRYRYHVYVIELPPDVLYEPRFRKANPDYICGKPCVFKYGLRLRPDRYEVYNPMPYCGAREMEVELAIGLRESGYGVWQA
jgi:hypothetical protein